MALEPECDISVVVRVRDDEEQVGHVLRRLTDHVRSLGLSFELFVSDEGSGDNTVAIAQLLKQSLPEVEVLHCDAATGYAEAVRRAKGRWALLYDVRNPAPLSALGFAIARLGEGADLVSVQGRYVLFRRARASRALDALVQRPPFSRAERAFIRRSQQLGLTCVTTQKKEKFFSFGRFKKLAFG